MYSLYSFFVFPFSNVYSNASEPRENPTFHFSHSSFSISFSPLLSFPFFRPIVKLSQYGNRFFSVCRFETLDCLLQEESGFRSGVRRRWQRSILSIPPSVRKQPLGDTEWLHVKQCELLCVCALYN